MSIKNDNIIHCSASGTESYDHCYSLGYKVGHEDWSPYPRVNALRKTTTWTLKGSVSSPKHIRRTRKLPRRSAAPEHSRTYFSM